MTKQQDQAGNVLVGMALLAQCPTQAMADVMLAYGIFSISEATQRQLTQAANRRWWDAVQLASRIQRDARLKEDRKASWTRHHSGTDIIQ